MIKLNLSGSMLGYICPFYLSNGNLNSAYYQYEIYSPGLTQEDSSEESCIPYISLTKISEKVKNDPSGKDIDILTALVGTNKDDAWEHLLGEYLKKENNIEIFNPGNGNFPYIVMQEGLNIQRSLIVNLRDSIRWKFYRFTPGRFIDILWTNDKFVVFKIEGNDTELWLKPVGMYNTSDVEMTNPLKVNLESIDYPKEKFSKEAGKISELNRMIKRLEWGSFDRNM